MFWILWAVSPDGTRQAINLYRGREEVQATKDLISLHNTDRTSNAKRALILVAIK